MQPLRPSWYSSEVKEAGNSFLRRRSVCGTSRHFVALRNLVRYRITADSGAPPICGSRPRIENPQADPD
jgi:hypothetical protein